MANDDEARMRAMNPPPLSNPAAIKTKRPKKWSTTGRPWLKPMFFDSVTNKYYNQAAYRRLMRRRKRKQNRTTIDRRRR